MKIGKDNLPLIATASLLVVMFGVSSFVYDGFFSIRVVTNLFTDNSYLGVTALGMMVVILAKGIDLSVGSVIGFTTMFVAWMIMDAGVPVPLAWAMSLLVGTLFGAAMGVLIVKYELPAFLVTLGGMFFARGMASVISINSIGIRNPLYDAVLDVQIRLAKGAYLGMGAIVFILFFVFVWYCLKWTRYGRYVYAVGGNEDSARLMGLPVDRIKILTYAFSGFCASLGGILYSFYTLSGYPLTGVGMELDAIAAVVIGGTLLTGGVGRTTGTLLGILIFGVMVTILNFDGSFESYTFPILKGLLLLIFILAQRFILYRKEA